MNIRPKNTILFALTGVKFSLNNLRGANWRQQVFNNYRLHLLDLLTKYGEAQDYGQWLNEMLSRHANIYNLAGGEKGTWEDVAYKNDLVGQYQQDYRGGLGNNGLYKRYGSVAINPDDKYDFNQTGIKTNQGTRYNIANPPTRTSGDYSREGYNYKVDNLYSAITDDRRLLGRKGDWDETSEDFKQWLKDLNSRGWETFLDNKDNYYKLRRIGESNPASNNPTPNNPTIPNNPSETTISGIPVGEKVDKEPILNKLLQGVNKVAPDLLDALRFAGNMHNNEKVYGELQKAIIPNLQLTYHTYRLVVGDEATKLAYYRRAAQGQTRAARPFTSDADRQMAYQMEAKRIGDELRAQGDLADNLRIRETSAESAAHADANTLRDTEVANSNLTELIKARAARHQLAALKYSADWTNRDQYLLGWLAKLQLRKAKEEALNDQLTTLDLLEDLLNDGVLQDLKIKREKSWNDYNSAKTDADREKFKKIFEENNTNYQKYYIQKLREALHRKYLVPVAKSGTKVTKKRETDKFLYKTSKDIVEHFRRMSKMTDDSRVRTLPKPIKLSSHPKKFLMGGIAPFTIYRPLGVGGDTTTTMSTLSDGGSSSSSKKSEAAKDKLDMIKELFKAIQGQGLPIDVSLVYLEISQVINKAKAFGEELSTDDIASMYLSSMLKINNLKYSKDTFDKAKALATANDALNEYAVTTGGKLVLQNSDTAKISLGTFEDIAKSEGKLNPLTNDLLLNLRAYSPQLALASGDELMLIVNNGVGMTKITAQIKSMASTLGSSELKIEGMSEVENKKIKAGLLILAGTDGTPDGFYKVTRDLKTSAQNVKAALNYIYNMLPNNYKTILEIHAGGKDNSKALIADMLNSQTSNFYKEDIAPLTGKASDKDKEAKDKDLSDGLKLDAVTALISGKGFKTEIELNPGSSYSVKALGRFTEFLKQGGGNMGAGTTMLEATESTLKGNLDWNKATIGGSRIIPTAYNQIVLNNGEVAGVDLPVDPNNPDVPNFEMLKQLENLDKQLKLNNIEDNEQNWLKVNDLCDKLNIPRKYDSSGKLNQLTWKRFAAFLVTTPDTALVDKNVILDMVGIASNLERELYNNFIKLKTKDKNFELSDKFLFFGHRDELYKGTVFVPVKESIVAAAISGGQNIYMNQATDLELREQGYSPDKISSYKKSEYHL